MAIADTYYNLLLAESIQELLDEGTVLTHGRIQTRLASKLENINLEEPLFDVTTALVTEQESASATKWNTTNLEIERDLFVIYKELYNVTGIAVQEFQRWRTEKQILEGDLRSLQLRVENLLQTIDDRNSYYVHDTFDNVSKIDLTRTTALVDVKMGHVSLSSEQDLITTKIDLNNVSPENITFTVLSRNHLINTVTPSDAPLKNAFDDTTRYWQTRVSTSSAQQPVVSELKIKTGTVSISKIEIILHQANTNSPVQITPLLSTDGINYYNIPNVENVTVSTLDKATWVFEVQDITHVKFLFAKTGYDFASDNNFIYEFGAEEISLFEEGYTADDAQVLESKTLSVNDITGNIVEFDTLTLEACEIVPAGTNIEYFVWASNDPTISGSWIQLDPQSRTNKVFPDTTSLGDTAQFELENCTISYSPTLSGADQNPAKDYSLVSFNGVDQVIIPQSISNVRYHLINSNDRILNHQAKGDVDILPNSVEIFRNIGAQNTSTKVRGYQRGWLFSEPYYISIIEVQSVSGLTIDFGDKPIILDDKEKRGKVLISNGLHRIKIHKDNWKAIDISLTTLDAVKSADPLFPFNHKLLIEGYDITDTANPYKGVDILCSHYMKEVPIADLIYNVSADDYNKFAIDKDAADSGTGKLADTVFVVKSNENMSDFLDEVFLVRFNVNNQLHTYFRLKAELTTTNESITPILESYSIRLSK